MQQSVNQSMPFPDRQRPYHFPIHKKKTKENLPAIELTRPMGNVGVHGCRPTLLSDNETDNATRRDAAGRLQRRSFKYATFSGTGAVAKGIIRPSPSKALHATGKQTGGFLRRTAATLPASTSKHAVQTTATPLPSSTSTMNFRRYYPRDCWAGRASNQFFRSHSMQLYFVPDGTAAEQTCQAARHFCSSSACSTSYSCGGTPSKAINCVTSPTTPQASGCKQDCAPSGSNAAKSALSPTAKKAKHTHNVGVGSLPSCPEFQGQWIKMKCGHGLVVCERKPVKEQKSHGTISGPAQSVLRRTSNNSPMTGSACEACTSGSVPPPRTQLHNGRDATISNFAMIDTGQLAVGRGELHMQSSFDSVTPSSAGDCAHAPAPWLKRLGMDDVLKEVSPRTEEAAEVDHSCESTWGSMAAAAASQATVSGDCDGNSALFFSCPAEQGSYLHATQPWLIDGAQSGARAHTSRGVSAQLRGRIDAWLAGASAAASPRKKASWLLNSPGEADGKDSARSMPPPRLAHSGFFSSLRARAGRSHDAPSKHHRLSGGGLLNSLGRRFRSDSSKRKLDRDMANTVDRSNTIDRCSDRRSVLSAGAETSASLNSLSDGRTPWPIPWLEAIFLPEYPNKSRVNEKHFQVVGTIASGAFGKVYRVALRAQPDAIFAMKVQTKSEVISKDAVQQIKDEVSIHESVGACPFVARMYAAWQTRAQLYMVLQYVLGFGDLYELWRDLGPFAEPVVRIYVAEADHKDHVFISDEAPFRIPPDSLYLNEYIHASGVIYRDLKMENIVLDEQGHIQIVDFGLAKWLEVGDRTMTICGTLQYMAPEISSGGPYGHAVDWWSMGVLAHVLIAGRYPFPPATDHWSLRYDGYVPPKQAGNELKQLCLQLLTPAPDARLCGVPSLMEQPFFSQFDVATANTRQLHPFDYIPRVHRCDSCNTLGFGRRRGQGAQNGELTEGSMTSSQVGRLTEGDDSYIARNFEEQYDPFSSFDYFSEDLSPLLNALA